MRCYFFNINCDKTLYGKIQKYCKRTFKRLYIRNNGIDEKLTVLGLFKNAQMQGAQKTEPLGVYKIYVERCGLQRNTADERFSTAS
jgi:hypothetical protein